MESKFSVLLWSLGFRPGPGPGEKLCFSYYKTVFDVTVDLFKELFAG